MQFSIRKILYCNRAHSFYQTKARLIAVSFKTIRRLKSSLALRHRLTTVLPTSIQLLLRKIYKRFMPLLLFCYYYTRRKTPCQVFFKIFFANCGFLRRIVVFFTAHALEKPTKCETQQTATIATNDEMSSVLRILEEIKKIVRHNREYTNIERGLKPRFRI